MFDAFFALFKSHTTKNEAMKHDAIKPQIVTPGDRPIDISKGVKGDARAIAHTQEGDAGANFHKREGGAGDDAHKQEGEAGTHAQKQERDVKQIVSQNKLASFGKLPDSINEGEARAKHLVKRLHELYPSTVRDIQTKLAEVSTTNTIYRELSTKISGAKAADFIHTNLKDYPDSKGWKSMERVWLHHWILEGRDREYVQTTLKLGDDIADW